MKIKPKVLALIVPLVLLGGYFAFSNLSFLQEEEHSTAAEERSLINASESESSTEVEGISGNTSLQSIADTYQIDVSILYDVFQIDESLDPLLFKSKDLEAIYVAGEVEIGNESMQAFVNYYKDLNVVFEEEVWLPQRAVDYLLDKVTTLSDEDKTYLESHGVDVVLVDSSTIVLSESESDSAEGGTLSGNTTLQNIIDMGVPQDELETLLGAKIELTNQLFKDFCTDKGLSYGTMKTVVQNAINS